MDQFIRDDLLREESSRDYVISSECNNKDGQEQRFVLEVKGLSSSRDHPHDRSSTDTASTRTKADDSFAKHQVNYSATKYIKP